MKNVLLSTLCLTAPLALAGPAVFDSGYYSDIDRRGDAPCMCREDAERVAGNFKDLINLDFNKTLAREAMTVDFVDFSDGVNELINAGCPGPNTLGQPTFGSRAEFIAGQSTQPPIP
jgi:hypothetical protein